VAPARPIGLTVGVAGHGGSADDPSVLGDLAAEPSAPLSREGLRAHESFVAAIDDDLDTPRAMRLARQTLASEDLAVDERCWLVLAWDSVLGLSLDTVWTDADGDGSSGAGRREAADEREGLSPTAEALLRQRTDARERRDFTRADALRDELHELGIEPIDRPDGSSDWRRVAPAAPAQEPAGTARSSRSRKRSSTR
jgi:cysteinyl-tRNA synthetase